MFNTFCGATEFYLFLKVCTTVRSSFPAVVRQCYFYFLKLHRLTTSGNAETTVLSSGLTGVIHLEKMGIKLHLKTLQN